MAKNTKGNENAPAGAAPGKARYNLRGRQVEPSTACWDAKLHVLNHEEIVAVAAGVPPYPTNADTLNAEIRELEMLRDLRKDPSAIAGMIPELDAWLEPGYDATLKAPLFSTPSAPPTDPVPTKESLTTRRPLSMFINLRPLPFGAVFNREREPPAPAVLNGQELARLFENETPGLIHRHALNFMIQRRNWAPPRQARVWAALDVAIESALIAAWHVKWRLNCDTHSYRQRPVEFDSKRVDVLFDRLVDANQAFDNGPRVPECKTCLSPGTPRHPAYPSGHSTYAGAASRMLIHFFPEFTRELEDLADNTGAARLWAGVHWRSDHLSGLRLGWRVSEYIIDKQLEEEQRLDNKTPIGVNPPMPPVTDPPPCERGCVAPIAAGEGEPSTDVRRVEDVTGSIVYGPRTG